MSGKARAAVPEPAAAPSGPEEKDLFSAIVSQQGKSPPASAEKAELSAIQIPKKQNQNNKLIWIACGSVIAVLAIGLGVLQLTGAFDRAAAVIPPPAPSGPPMLVLDKPTRMSGTAADEAAIAALSAQDSTPADAPNAADRPVADSLRELKNWRTDIDAAKSEAQQSKKDLLLVFFGADRRDWCLKLAKEVLLTPDFRRFADRKFTFVFFEAKGATFDEGSTAAKLVADYHVTSYPTLVFADAEGLPYAQQEYVDPARTNYLTKVQDALVQRKNRDEVLIPTTKGSDDEKLAAAEKFLQWLGKHDLIRLYGPKIHEWIELAERVDPHNEQGRNEAIFLTDWIVRLDDAEKQGPAQIHAVAESLEAWKTKHKFKDPNFAAKTHLQLAAMLFQAGDQEGAGQYLQEALDCGPTDERLRRRLEMIVGRSNSPISSGSGFVIADGGLILTNNHVIEGPGKVWVRINGEEKEARATLVAADPKHDIALVKLDEMPKMPLKPLTVSGVTPGPGADIAVFGYPLGDVLGGGVKFTAGAISAPPDKGRGDMYLLNCTVNHGNSGGPMCDKRGQVVGLVSAKTSVGDADSYGMALPPNTMAQFLKTHLPEFKTAPATADKKLAGWDEVYAQVSPSVVMILKRMQ